MDRTMIDDQKQTFIDLMMSYNHLDTSREDKRLIAVTAALELIKSDAAGGNADLDAEMNNLSKYADNIQMAIKNEKQP